MDANEASSGAPRASDLVDATGSGAENSRETVKSPENPISPEKPDQQDPEEQSRAERLDVQLDERRTDELNQREEASSRPDESPADDEQADDPFDDPFEDPRNESNQKTVDARWSGVDQTNMKPDHFSQTNADQPASDNHQQQSYVVRYPAYSRKDKQTQLDPNELTSKLTDLKIYDATSTASTGHLPDLISDLVGSSQKTASVQSDAKSNVADDDEEIPSYQVKWIKFRGKQCAIIMQNVNGCCPLLAIMNVLLLRGKIQLPLATKLVTYDQVIVFLANFILENGANSAPEGLQLDYEQNINDAMQLFPKLQTGLDVNVQFNGVTSFERHATEMIIFDMLGISLYHGWIVDRDDVEASTVIGSCSYNQLVDKIITNKSSSKSEEVSEALIAERFLESTASQLTYFGLSELVSNVREQELSILFRNNHFITLYKNQVRGF